MMVDLVGKPIPVRRLAELDDVTITSIADGEIIVWDSGTSQYINNTLAEAGVAADGDVLKKDGTVALTGNWSAGGNRITTLGTPSSSGDAATKGYVDGLLSGLDLKASVRVATTGAGTLASDFENGDTIDGVTLATGNRILIKNQSTASENGIYVVAASGAPTRASDFAATATVAGAYCFVEEGGTNGDKGFVCTSNAGSDVVGTNNLAFTQFNGAGGVSVLDDLSDVIITTAASGHFLRYNGSNWINVGLVAADLPAMVGDSGSGGTKGAVPAPSAGDAAANKYLKADGTWATVSGGSGSSHWHDPVECVTTADVSLSGGGIANGTTHDGITVSTGNRILVANQTSTTENGIYIVPASGAASRASDMAAAYNASGDVVAIKRGTLYADYWAMVTSNSSVVGTDPITVALLNNGATAKELGWPANLLINSSFREWGHTVSTSGVTLTDGAYAGPTGWYQLTSGNLCTIALGTGIGSSGGSFKITNGAGAARRVAIAQFVEYYDCLPLRGKAVRFSIKVKQTTTGNMRAALVNWTGTANAPTKDIVNTWSSTTYTEGNFFISSGNLDIIAVSSAVSVGSTPVEISVTGTVGASTNNLQMIVWSEDEFHDTEIIEFGDPMLVLGSTAVQYQDQPLNIEKFLAEYRCILHYSDANQTDAILGWGHAASTTVAVCQVPLGRPMRVVPTLTATAGDWQVADSVGARQDVTALAISSTVSSRRIIVMTSTVAPGLTVGRGMATVADTTSGRFLVFDAEIGT